MIGSLRPLPAGQHLAEAGDGLACLVGGQVGTGQRFLGDELVLHGPRLVPHLGQRALRQPDRVSVAPDGMVDTGQRDAGHPGLRLIAGEARSCSLRTRSYMAIASCGRPDASQAAPSSSRIRAVWAMAGPEHRLADREQTLPVVDRPAVRTLIPEAAPGLDQHRMAAVVPQQLPGQPVQAGRAVAQPLDDCLRYLG